MMEDSRCIHQSAKSVPSHPRPSGLDSVVAAALLFGGRSMRASGLRGSASFWMLRVLGFVSPSLAGLGCAEHPTGPAPGPAACVDYGRFMHWQSRADTPGIATGVAISGTHALVSDMHSGLQVIDITYPGSPQIVGSVDTPGYAKGGAASGRSCTSSSPTMMTSRDGSTQGALPAGGECLRLSVRHD
jgi:hypothetical protein